VPGRIVALGLGVDGAADGDVVAVELGLGTGVVAELAVVEGDVALAAATAVVGDVAVAGDGRLTGSAFAGTQAAMARTTSNDPVAPGQWRSG
jgi:hypothetical protein